MFGGCSRHHCLQTSSECSTLSLLRQNEPIWLAPATASRGNSSSSEGPRLRPQSMFNHAAAHQAALSACSLTICRLTNPEHRIRMNRPGPIHSATIRKMPPNLLRAECWTEPVWVGLTSYVWELPRQQAHRCSVPGDRAGVKEEHADAASDSLVTRLRSTNCNRMSSLRFLSRQRSSSVVNWATIFHKFPLLAQSTIAPAH